MKKLIYMLAAAALVSAGAVSCSDEKTDDPVEPVTVSSSMRLNGGNVLVNVPGGGFRRLDPGRGELVGGRKRSRNGGQDAGARSGQKTKRAPNGRRP